MTEWPKHRVDHLQERGILFVEDGNHGEYRPRQNEFQALGTAFIRAADMDAGQIHFDSAQKLNDVALKRIRKGFGRGGDVLFSHKGTVGKLALAPEDAPPFVCSPQTTFWRVMNEKRLDRRFLYYYMQSEEFTNQWHARKAETDMADYVSLTSQRELTVALPEIGVQRSMGKALGVLDDKIELNCRMNRTLKHMASALFKSWFVDFDPVVAKAAGRKPYGMEDATAALFPDGFEESEIGPIPRGWKAESLDRAAEFLNGLAMQKFPVRAGEEHLPVIKIAELRVGNTLGADRASLDVPADYVIDDGDLLFSWSGSLVVDVWTGGRGALNQHLFKVTSKEWPKWFVYEWLLEHLPDFQGTAADKATTMGHIRRHHLSEAKVVLPTKTLIDEANRTFEPWLQKRISNSKEMRSLAALRDRLLPELLSGELYGADAEKQVATRNV